jgi:hypothetical protein
VLCCGVLCCAVSLSVTSVEGPCSCCAVLWCAVLSYLCEKVERPCAVLYCAMLYCAVLCDAMQYCPFV